MAVGMETGLHISGFPQLAADCLIVFGGAKLGRAAQRARSCPPCHLNHKEMRENNGNLINSGDLQESGQSWTTMVLLTAR